jgi:hypothetical protein
MAGIGDIRLEVAEMYFVIFPFWIRTGHIPPTFVCKAQSNRQPMRSKSFQGKRINTEHTHWKNMGTGFENMSFGERFSPIRAGECSGSRGHVLAQHVPGMPLIHFHGKQVCSTQYYYKLCRQPTSRMRRNLTIDKRMYWLC